MGKIERLEEILKALKSVVIAYSGGLDSTFLLKMAVDTLGKENVIAVTARSETYPSSEYRSAVECAKYIGAKHITIKTKELDIRNFRSNPVNRCYYCKRELFKKLDDMRKARAFDYVLDGTNIDDLKDVRFGRKAAEELGVKSPLLKARITKDDIRLFSKGLNLPTWDKASFACLASRIPFNSAIDKKVLAKIEKAEDFFRQLGVRQVRVRAHKDIARIEVEESDFDKVLKMKKIIIKKLRKLGFVYITLDLLGYRTGSLHEALQIDKKM